MLKRSSFVSTWLVAMSMAASMAACGGESLKGAPDEEACDVGSKMTETRMFFGFGRKDAPPVTQEEWQDFLDEEVTPRFRDGLTVIEADGQYLGMDGTLEKEDARVLILIHDGSEAGGSDIEAIRDAYKARFDQESVLREDQQLCVAF